LFKANPGKKDPETPSQKKKADIVAPACYPSDCRKLKIGGL
jgi:hypothetical protein